LQDRSHLLTHVISRLVSIDDDGSWQRRKETMRRFLDRRLRFRRASVATRRFHDDRRAPPTKMPQCCGYFAAPVCLIFIGARRHRTASTARARRRLAPASLQPDRRRLRNTKSPRFRGRSLSYGRRRRSAALRATSKHRSTSGRVQRLQLVGGGDDRIMNPDEVFRVDPRCEPVHRCGHARSPCGPRPR
jgi:hypothetical protein